MTVKYVGLILRADNDGEGGILALAALLDLHHHRRGTPRNTLVAVTIAGGALLFGDAVITPGISVLSAVEGLEAVAPSLAKWSVPSALAILAGFFFAQRFGAMRIARLFGPIMLLWFVVLALAGMMAILRNPTVLAALSPSHAIAMGVENPGLVPAIVGAIFLAMTGGEALYADLGQFGRPAISRAWLLVAFPSLLLNYFGQGARLLEAGFPVVENPFFGLFAPIFSLPVVILAMLATIIASQAVITGLFSLSRQAIELGFLPPMRVVHMTPTNEHDVFVPVVNGFVALLTLGIVSAFGSSDRLAGAYGVSVAGAMATTTVLYLAYKTSIGKARGGGGWLFKMLMLPILLLDIVFVLASVSKLPSGGYLPLLLAGIVMLLVVSWRTGRKRTNKLPTERTHDALSVMEIIEVSEPATGCTGVFLVRPGVVLPRALSELVELAGSRFAHVVLLSVTIAARPRVDAEARLAVTRLSRSASRMDIRVGYMQRVNLPAIAAPGFRDLGLKADTVTYITGLERPIAPERIRSVSSLLILIYSILAKLATRTTDRFALPPARTLEIGIPRKL